MLWRGVRYRAGRSLVVLLLAAVATTAAAVTPAYVLAAQESVQRDLLVLNPGQETTISVQNVLSPQIPQSSRLTHEQAVARAKEEFAALPELQRLVTESTAHVETNLKLALQRPGTIVTGHLAYRTGVCDHVVVTGACPARPGEVMVSARSAELHKIKLGEPLPISVGPEADEGRTAEMGGSPQAPSPQAAAPIVTGLYTPKDPGARYWNHGSLLGFSNVADIHLRGTFWSLDAVFAGVPQDVEAVPRGISRSYLKYWLDLDSVRIAGAAQLEADILDYVKSLEGRMNVSSPLPSLLAEIIKDQKEIASTVPIGAVPLLVLALAVLMVLVAALTEERGPEIALAKLHGYHTLRVGGFGLGEVLFLVTLAAPAGIVLGWLALFTMARLWLSQGIPVTLPWQSFAAVGICLLVTYVAAVVASRRVIGTRIINLLRRVPQRATWKASALEGAAAALAIAALVTAVQDRGSGLALLAPPLLAIVVGIVGGRLLSLRSAGSLRRAKRKGDVAGMITGSALSRRPGRVRIIVVVAVATALMGFSAAVWDASSQARAENAGSMVGAHTVYSVTATGADRLVAAVNDVTPDGSAMAVVRRQEFYGGDTIQVVGVQSGRLATAASWYGHTAQDLSNVATKLQPAVPPPAAVGGKFTLNAEANGFGTFPLDLIAEVRVGGDIARVKLGRIKQGSADYTATVPDGLLTALVLERPPADPVLIKGSFVVQSITSDKGSLDIGDASFWQPIVVGGSKAGVIGNGTLRLDLEASGNGDIRLVRLRSPKALPVVLTGSAPTQNGDPLAPWNFMAFANQPQPFEVVQQEKNIPGGYGHGYLTDLETGINHAMDTSRADPRFVYYEVWANANAPKDLAERLSGQGIQVYRTQTLDAFSAQLSRRAPALALSFYGLAGLVAVLLALGIVVLAARIGADQRRYELASLRVTGVPERVLRRGIRREYLTLLGWPSITGLLAGVASALFMLPAIPLVRSGVTSEVDWRPTPLAIGVVLAAGLACLAVALPIAVRLVRQASPDLLRDTY